MINKKQTFLGKKMLIIGDDSAFINSIELMFLYAGIDILIFNDFKKGALAIKTQKPDLILLESTLDGDLLQNIILEINAQNDCGIPFILIADTNTDSNNNIAVTKIIQKTNIDIVSLIRTIENLLKDSSNIHSHESLVITEKKAETSSVSQKEIRVLVVEDDPLLRNLLSVRLTKSKIPYYFCHNGNEVLHTALHYKPTLVILDLMLPGKNGIDVLNEMRQRPEFRETPVVVFSNKDNDEDKKKAKMLGVDDFLIKAMTDLNDLVTLIINKHSS